MPPSREFWYCGGGAGKGHIVGEVRTVSLMRDAGRVKVLELYESAQAVPPEDVPTLRSEKIFHQLSKVYGSQAKALIVAIEKLKQEITTMSDAKKYSQKPFRRSEVDPNNHDGWVVDLSTGDTVNPDCYWYFRTRKQAQVFLDLLNAGYDSREASHIAHGGDAN